MPIPDRKNRPLPTLLITRREWPRITQLPLSTLDDLIALGDLRPVRVGRRQLFLWTEIERWARRVAASGKNPQPHRRHRALKEGAAE